MITYAIMALIMLFLAFELLYKAEYMPEGNHLFDKQNSNAMRGFWCVIVILVHIPAAYQNRLQDMLGSFAYIGVTFFFMTSAYGLRLSIAKNPDSLKYFWRKRLPKLLIPMLLVNIVSLIYHLVEGKGISFSTLINFNGWVQWLLVCYVIFWAVNRFVTFDKHLPAILLFVGGGGYNDVIVCVLIAVFSITVYALQDPISGTTWCPEVFGFVWGIVFFHIKDRFANWMGKKWLPKCLAFCIIAGIAGVAYLKFKPVVFFGDYLLKILLGVLIITFLLAMNSRISIGNKVSFFLGSISYEVYLIHHVVFDLVVFLVPQAVSGVFIIISIVLTLLISVAIRKEMMVLKDNVR